jgi:hypothetical protein
MTGKFVKQEEVDKFLKNIKEIVEKNKELKSELTKYKRAFEILKPIINIDNNIEEGGKEYWLSDIWGLRKLTKEQCELLEELMDSE